MKPSSIRGGRLNFKNQSVIYGTFHHCYDTLRIFGERRWRFDGYDMFLKKIKNHGNLLLVAVILYYLMPVGTGEPPEANRAIVYCELKNISANKNFSKIRPFQVEKCPHKGYL